MVLMPNACLIQGRQTIHASSAVSLKDFTTASGGSRVSPKPMVSRTMRFPSWDVTALYVVYHVYIYIYTRTFNQFQLWAISISLSSTFPFLSSQASVDVALRTWGLYASRLMSCNFWRWMPAQTWFMYSSDASMNSLRRFHQKARTSQNFWKINWPQISPHDIIYTFNGTVAKTSSMYKYEKYERFSQCHQVTDSAEVTEATESPASNAGKPPDRCRGSLSESEVEDVLVLGSKENMTDAGIKMPTEVGPPRSMSGKLENKQTTRKSESLFWWYSKCWWGWAVLTMIMMMMRRRRRWRMIHDSWLYVTVITRLPSRGLTLWQLSSTLAATEARLCFFPVSTLPETRFGTLQEICSWTLPERQSRASVEIRGIHGHQC